LIEWRVIEKLPKGIRYRKFVDGKPTNGYRLIMAVDPIIDEQVGQSSDDAKEMSGAVTLTGTALDSQWSTEWFGLRWTGISIPSGATISVAYLTVRVVSTSTDDPCEYIYCQNANNPGTFTTGANDITNRTRTSVANRTDWDAIGVGAGWKNSPSIVTSVQQVVDDNGGTGDALVVIFDHHSFGQFSIRTWDYFDHTEAAKIHIEYTEGLIELSLTDGLKVGDTLARNMTASVSRTDGIKTGDIFSQLSTMSPTLSDGLKLGDSLLAAVTFWLSLTEGINLGDTLTRTMEAFPTLTDGIKLSEAFDVSNTADLSLADGVTFGDALAILYKIQFTLSDGIIFSDTNLAEIETGIIFLTLRDGLNLGDSPLAEMLANLELSDGTKLGDSPLINILASLGITDGLTFGDTTLKLVKLLTLSDGVKIADAGQLSALMNVSISDGMKLGDVPMINYFFRVISLVVQLYNRNLTTKLRFKSGI